MPIDWKRANAAGWLIICFMPSLMARMAALMMERDTATIQQLVRRFWLTQGDSAARSYFFSRFDRTASKCSLTLNLTTLLIKS